MTSLIRQADLDGTTPVASLETASRIRGGVEEFARPVREPAQSPQEIEIRKLRDALGAADQKLDQLVAAACEQGRREALDSAARDEAKALAVLEGGVKEAVTLFRQKSGEIESLALAIAEHALAGVFANPKSHQPLVADAIQRQLSAVRRESVLAIHVSSADFPDAAALAELERKLGQGDVRILPDRALSQGASRIDVRLGHIELSLSEHWAALRSRLQELATNGGGRR